MTNNSIIIKNKTNENVRIAIFRHSLASLPKLNTIAWRVITPPQQGQTKVMLSTNYEVFVNYPNPEDDRTEPYAGNQTQKIRFTGYTACFNVRSSKTPVGQFMLRLEQNFQHRVPEEIKLFNNSGFGVWSHIAQGGNDIFLPRIIPPGRALIEKLTPVWFLATVEEFVIPGSKIRESVITSDPTEIKPNHTASISGSVWTGYSIELSPSENSAGS